MGNIGLDRIGSAEGLTPDDRRSNRRSLTEPSIKFIKGLSFLLISFAKRPAAPTPPTPPSPSAQQYTR